MVQSKSKDIKKWNKIFFDAIPNAYDQQMLDSAWAAIFFEKKFTTIKKYLLKYGHEAKILDAGCGNGNWLSRLRNKGFVNLYGIDISSKMVKNARIKNPQNFYIVGDLEQIPVKKSVFDVVITNSIFHHLPNPLQALKDVNKIMKRGGTLLICHEPNLRAKFFDPYSWVLSLVSKLNINYTDLPQREKLAKKILHEKALARKDLTHQLNMIQDSYVDYKKGFLIEELNEMITKADFDVIDAKTELHSSCYNHKLLRNSRTTLRILFQFERLLERLPFLKKLGTSIVIIARKM